MKRGLKGFAFLVSGLVLGIIGARWAWQKYAVPTKIEFRRKEHDP